MTSKHKKPWHELSFSQRCTIRRHVNEVRESPENQKISRLLGKVLDERDQKNAKMDRLRAFLLSKHPQQ